MKRVTASLVLLLIATPVLAQEPVEREHVVKKGDTLWDLAGFYFNDPFTWPTIYRANTSVVEDPHWIYPDEVLVIPGRPDRREAAPAAPAEPTTRMAAGPAQPPARTVFYHRPSVPTTQETRPTVLSETVRERVPVRSGEFSSAPFVTRPGSLHVMGRFLRALRENRDVGGAPTAHPQELVYLSYAGSERPDEGEFLLLVKEEHHPGGAPSGTRILVPTAVLRVTKLGTEVIEGRIEDQFGPVHGGNLAIPMPMYPDFMVDEAQPMDAPDLEARVLEFLGDPPLPGRADVAFINVGAADGVKAGDVFTAYLPERGSMDRAALSLRGSGERLPPEDVAFLRVVRVMDRVATVKVDELMLPRLEDGIRVHRTRRIP